MIVQRFKEFPIFLKIMVVLCCIGLVGFLQKSVVHFADPNKSALLIFGTHAPGWPSFALRLLYAALISAFLFGLFKKRLYGYFAIQTYVVLIGINSIATLIGIFLRPAYFSDYFAAKAAQITNIETNMGNLVYYSTLGSAIGMILISAWLITAFKKRKEHFQ